jgi:hypothetical protein
VKRVPPSEYPWWVKLGMIGSSSRRALWGWAIASLVAAAACLLVGLWLAEAYFIALGAIGFPLAALMYWLTIRWIDQHGSWEA